MYPCFFVHCEKHPRFFIPLNPHRVHVIGCFLLGFFKQGACHWVFSAWTFHTGCMSLGVFCLDFSHRVHVIGCFLLGFFTQGACHWVFSAWIFLTGCMSLGVFCLDFSNRVHVIGCFLLGFVFLAPYGVLALKPLLLS